MSSNSPDKITLFTNSQIWYHKHTIHFIFLLIITGLPLVSSWFSWLAYVIGVPFTYFNETSSYQETIWFGVEICRVIHRLVALLWILLSIPFIIQILPKISSWQIIPSRKVGQSWKEYLIEGLEDVKLIYIDWKYPKHMKKYNIAQIVAAWGVIFLCILMIVSGIILLLRTDINPIIVSFAKLGHITGFGGIIIFLIIHIYFAVHPVNRAGYEAMFRDGKDTIEHAKLKHPGLFIDTK